MCKWGVMVAFKRHKFFLGKMNYQNNDKSCHLYLTLAVHNVYFYKVRIQMQVKYYLQKLIVKRVSNDDEYLAADAEISPKIIDLMSLKSETIANQNAAPSGHHTVKLDEHEWAMAS